MTVVNQGGAASIESGTGVKSFFGSADEYSLEFQAGAASGGEDALVFRDESTGEDRFMLPVNAALEVLNQALDVRGQDIEDAGTQIYDAANTEIPNSIVEALANFAVNDVFDDYPVHNADVQALQNFALGDQFNAYPLADADVSGLPLDVVPAGAAVADQIDITAGGTSTIQPPAGEQWSITAYFTLNQVTLEATDGTLTDEIAGGGSNVYNTRIPIDNALYLQFNNTDACDAREAAYHGSKISSTMTGDMVDITAGGTSTIQPPAGDDWVVQTIYVSNGLIEVDSTDGTDVVPDILGTTTIQEDTHIPVTNANYLRFNNTDSCNARHAGFNSIQTA